MRTEVRLSVTCQICRHSGEYLGDQDRHLVLHAALDGDAQPAGLPGLGDHHLPPPGRDVAGDGDVGVALRGDDVDVIVQSYAQVKSLQSDTVTEND